MPFIWNIRIKGTTETNVLIATVRTNTAWFPGIIPITTNLPALLLLWKAAEGLIHVEEILGSGPYSQSLEECRRLKQCLHRELFPFPENANCQSIVLIVAQLIEGLPVAVMRKRLSYPIYPSPPCSMCASKIRIKYPNISGTLCGQDLLSTAT